MKTEIYWTIPHREAIRQQLWPALVVGLLIATLMLWVMGCEADSYKVCTLGEHTVACQQVDRCYPDDGNCITVWVDGNDYGTVKQICGNFTVTPPCGW